MYRFQSFERVRAVVAFIGLYVAAAASVAFAVVAIAGIWAFFLVAVALIGVAAIGLELTKAVAFATRWFVVGLAIGGGLLAAAYLRGIFP